MIGSGRFPVRLLEAEMDESKFRSVFTLSIPNNLLLNQVSQLVLDPTQDLTDSEALAIPLEVISHPPTLNLRISEGFFLRDLLGAEERADLAICCAGSLDAVSASVEDSRFEAGLSIFIMAHDCKMDTHRQVRQYYKVSVEFHCHLCKEMRHGYILQTHAHTLTHSHRTWIR